MDTADNAAMQQRLREGLAWVRRDTQQTLFISVGIALWLWLLTYLTNPDDFWPGWGTLLLLLCILAGCFALRDRVDYFVISSIFSISLFGGAVAFLGAPGMVSGQGPLLFLPAILIAGALLGPWGALSFAGATTLVLLLVFGHATPTREGITLIAALPILWLTAFTSWATTTNLLTALSWAWADSQHAEKALQEARGFQAKLAQAKRQLEEANYRLGRANHALAWARQEAEEARRAKASFAAHVSHELRTPINLVVGFTELMVNHPETYGQQSLPPAYLADMTALHRSATHLQTLINDILDLSQLEAGQMPILRDVSEMTSVITEAVSIARPLLERRGLTLTVDVPATLPLLSIDRVRIRQVILNLINNAIRFTDQGGITITAYTENHELVIAVRDTGIGIRQEDIARLFAAYQQLDQSPTRSRGGTGLGLAISRHFVELHGGRIWAESAGPGSGSTFAFTLPLLTTAIDTTLLHANDPAQRWAIDPVNAPRPTLVLWERDEAVTTLFQRYLPTFAIVGAATFEEACKLAEQRAAHAIIVDSSDALPPATLETIQSLEARVLCCPLPSGRRSVQAAGIADYLVKPVTRETLLRSVRDVCPHAQKILVVDDQRDMVRLLCRMLRSAPEQYTLIRGFSGHEALDLMRQNRPDVVILDLLMPEMDGLSVLEHMKTELDLATIPVVVVSAKGAAEAVTPSTARSMTLINDRSFAITELLHTVNALLTSLPPRAPEMVSSGGALQEG